MKNGVGRPPGFHGSYHTDFAVRSAYSEGAGPYRIVPAAVAIPSGPDDLLSLIRYSVDSGTSLVPRGAGSGMPGGNVGPGIVVDLREFKEGPTATTDKSCRAGAAVTWGAADRAARALGYRMATNPSSGAFCTVGGNVATDAAGSRSLRYGSIRRWVGAVELATSDAELGWVRRPGARANSPSEAGLGALTRLEQHAKPAIHEHASTIERCAPRTTKNTAGYALGSYLRTSDPVDLIVGSEGTLGIVTRVELELQEVPGGTSALLLIMDNLDPLCEVVAGLVALDPAAVELLDRTFLHFATSAGDDLGDAECALLVEFERASADEARAAVDRAARLVARSAKRVETALDGAERDRLWAVRHAASPALARLGPKRRSLQIVEDGCVPLPRLSEYLRGARRIADRLEIEIVAFGHAGDGHLHINALVDPSSEGLEERLAALLHEVTDLVIALGGTPSGEHGDGRLRAGILERVYGSELTGLFREVKNAFDPHGVMNPGVIVPVDRTPAIQSLKVGSRAASIPDSIAERLALLERTGGWATPKTDLASGVTTSPQH